MITFVDTNILIDVFLPDPVFGEPSKEKLEQAFENGSLVINQIIYSELAPQFGAKNLLDQTLTSLGIQVLSIDTDSAFQAGMLWRKYRLAGGKKNRIISDFLIGAHALNCSDALLTRDRGFYKTYFSDLSVI